MVRQLLTAALVAGAFLTAGCNTIAGVGRDMSSAGHATTKAADRNK